MGHAGRDALMDFFYDSTSRCPIIAAVNNDELLRESRQCGCEIIYILYGNICTIPDIVREVKNCGKKAVVHIDLINGLAPKDICVDYIRNFTLADGIISTKPNLIRRANELDLLSIQRFFMMDQLAYTNIKTHVRDSCPDIVEMMPAGLAKMIRYACGQINGRPLVASGLVLDRDDVIGALSAGALAVSTTNRDIWKMAD